jgi:hypothetical protein
MAHLSMPAASPKARRARPTRSAVSPTVIPTPGSARAVRAGNVIPSTRVVPIMPRTVRTASAAAAPPKGGRALPSGHVARAKAPARRASVAAASVLSIRLIRLPAIPPAPKTAQSAATRTARKESAPLSRAVPAPAMWTALRAGRTSPINAPMRASPESAPSEAAVARSSAARAITRVCARWTTRIASATASSAGSMTAATPASAS